VSNPSKKRNKTAQVLLLESGLCASLIEAQAFIYAGQAYANEQRIQKPGQLLSVDTTLRVKKKPYVSRGGVKLIKAIEDLHLRDAFRDKVVLDVGASTGGFTDCVLQLGAKNVIALDIGFNQLDWSLKTNAKVLSLEKTDIRTFDASPFGTMDWILADISFNSLEQLAPDLIRPASLNSQFLILVKPQFELPEKDVPEGGIVKDEASWNKAIAKVLSAFEALGLSQLQVSKSGLKGRYGNQEFFVYGCLSAASTTEGG
jgi:23S rRNA (cytidine1920-2'-O)/16S rRNA (cytidine1409-2'-O)-methyltransferase